MWTWRLERALFPPAKVAEVKHDWVPLERISRELQLAVIAAEDQRFADHNGFDMDAISSALKHNQQSRRVRGASSSGLFSATLRPARAVAALLLPPGPAACSCRRLALPLLPVLPPGLVAC